MSITNTPARRILTVIAVAASLVIGFGAIRASAAWTATAAPLAVAPVSAETLKARLADESARSADLVDRLAALTTHAEELSAALAAAEARIGSDTDHATQLAKDLAAAKKKLAALETSIRAASKVRTVAPTTTTRTTTSGSTQGGEDEHEDEHDD
jgi:chromosome segregation ATPase